MKGVDIFIIIIFSILSNSVYASEYDCDISESTDFSNIYKETRINISHLDKQKMTKDTAGLDRYRVDLKNKDVAFIQSQHCLRNDYELILLKHQNENKTTALEEFLTAIATKHNISYDMECIHNAMNRLENQESIDINLYSDKHQCFNTTTSYLDVNLKKIQYGSYNNLFASTIYIYFGIGYRDI